MAIERTAPPREEGALPIAPPETYVHPVRKAPGTSPKILVLCDAPTTDAAFQQIPMSMDNLRYFANRALKAGFVQGDMMFVGLCPPVKKSIQNSAAKTWDYVSQYQEGVRAIIAEHDPAVVVTLGNLASRVMLNRAVKINKARGVATNKSYDGRLVFPMLTPASVKRQPDNLPIFDADMSTLHRLQNEGFDPSKLQPNDVDYRWCTDISELLGENKPGAIAVDTETTGLNYRAEGFEVITVQISPRPGVSLVCPVSKTYCDRHAEDFKALGIDVGPRARSRLKAQIKQLLEDPDVKKLAANFKYDNGALTYGMGVKTQSWAQDTELMCRAVNENMFTYSLDDITRIYCPEMAGYADHFNQKVNKGDMMSVQPMDTFDLAGEIDKPGMLSYAGGDPDAVYRCARALYPMLQREPGQLFLYNRVQMRGLIAFSNAVEVNGQCIDREALEAYTIEVDEWVREEEVELFKLIPAPIRHKWLVGEKATVATADRTVQNILYGKDDFIRDVLFSDDGLGLKPKVFTKSTRDADNAEDRVPSVSTKDHMPYFVTEKKRKAGEWVLRYIELAKAKKMLTTYLAPFDKYIKPANDNDFEEKIYPSYNFRTNTHRTNSQDPNGQNFPKRGKFAKGFLRLIKASAGKVLVAADLSQIELRLVAWAAMEPEMLAIYNSGGDIHQATAAAVMRLTIDQFLALSPEEQKLQRFRAKAVNFGFIYGAQWRTFQTYAKTTYGVDYTDKEAQETRELFFDKYKLIPWHKNVEAFVRKHGYVPTLHGGVRHLPSVWSDDYAVSSGAVRQAINAPIQWMGSDMGVIAITRLAAQADPRLIRPIGFVHDQVICEVEPEYYQQGMGWLKWVMETPPLTDWFGITPPLPIVADPDFGPNLADAVEIKHGGDGLFRIDQGPRKGEVLENLRVEKPDWWNDNEEDAWDNFLKHQINNLDHDQQREHVRQMLTP